MTLDLNELYPAQLQPLQHSIQTNALHHAYTFAGRSGGGQTAIAEWLATTLVGTATSPDLYRIAPLPGKQAISIQQVRGLIDHLSSFPVMGDHRVAIVDQADRLTTAAANALLKMIEEPPKRSRIILVTDNASQLLPTIVSRVQLTFVPKIAEQLVEQKMSSVETEVEKEQLLRSINGRFDRLAAYCSKDAAWDSWQTERQFWVDFLKSPLPARQKQIEQEFLKTKRSQEALHELSNRLPHLAEIIYRSWLHERSENGILSAKASVLQRMLTDVTRLQTQLEQNANKKMILDYLVFGL